MFQNIPKLSRWSQAARYLVLLSAVSAAVAVPVPTIFRRTVTQVEADITNIATQVNALDTAINAFPNTGGTLLAALVGIKFEQPTPLTILTMDRPSTMMQWLSCERLSCD